MEPDGQSFKAIEGFSICTLSEQLLKQPSNSGGLLSNTSNQKKKTSRLVRSVLRPGANVLAGVEGCRKASEVHTGIWQRRFEATELLRQLPQSLPLPNYMGESYQQECNSLLQIVNEVRKVSGRLVLSPDEVATIPRDPRLISCLTDIFRRPFTFTAGKVLCPR